MTDMTDRKGLVEEKQTTPEERLELAIARKVVELGAKTPHIFITADDGVHVIPVYALRMIASGEEPPYLLDDNVLRVIIADYMRRVVDHV